MQQVDLTKLTGWTRDEELPVGAQGVIMLRKFLVTTSVFAANAIQLQKDVQDLLKGIPPQGMNAALMGNPFYVKCMQLLEDEANTKRFAPADARFRRNAAESFAAVQGDVAEALINLAIALWAQQDGGTVPDDILQLAQRVDAEASDDDDKGDEEE